MAYTNTNTQRPAHTPAAGKPAASAGFQGQRKEFTEDPTEVGLVYEKESEKVGTYYSVVVKKDIPAGAKLVIFKNKNAGKSEKTPTHIMKLSKTDK